MPYASQFQGDYKTYGYAGDPGFLSKLWKGFKSVAKFIPGPIGTVARLAGAVGIATGAAAVLQPTPPIIPGRAVVPYGPMPLSPAGQVTRFAPGRNQTYGQGPMAFAPGGAPPGGACPTGFHLAKDGSGRWVRNRRMNIANPRALRRAMRRVQGFEKLAKRTITFTRRTKLKTRKS